MIKNIDEGMVKRGVMLGRHEALLPQGSYFGDAFKVFITVQKQRAVLQGDLSNAAVNRAIDGDAFAPQLEINPGGISPS